MRLNLLVWTEMRLEMIMSQKLKILLWAILVVLGLYVAFVLFILIRGPFYHLIPDVSYYPRGICFSARGDESYDPLDWNRPQKTYNQVLWTGKTEEGKPLEDCPLIVEADGSVWKAGDFQYDAFLARGATDDRVENANVFGDEVDWSTPPTATYRSTTSLLMIGCKYKPDKTLYEVVVFFEYNPYFYLPPGSLPLKEIQITIPEGTVTLPADHKTMVRSLGKPTKHIPAHTIYVNHIL